MKLPKSKIKKMIRLALVEATDIGRARFTISDPLRSRNIAEASETAIHNIIFFEIFRMNSIR